MFFVHLASPEMDVPHPHGGLTGSLSEYGQDEVHDPEILARAMEVDSTQALLPLCCHCRFVDLVSLE